MRRRRRLASNGVEEDSEVPLSPLIDCVFLLLIFFLVTTMLKRKEMLIPIQLPDQSSAVASEPQDRTIIIGIDAEGVAYAVDPDRSGRDGELVYRRVGDLATYLKQLVDTQGQAVLERPLRIDCDRETPFQTGIDILDICKLQGFDNVGLRTRDRKL